MYKLFVVEDDAGIASGIEQLCASWDMEVYCVRDFRAVIAEFAANAPHLVLLDISLPFCNGYHWCQELRRISSVPIVFLSSAADNMNMVMAMNMGADDFIAKPFDKEVFLAKLQAILRRTYAFAQTTPILTHRGAVLHLGDGTLTYGTETLALSRNEFRILKKLMEEKGRVVSREKLMETLWETDSFIDENTLTVNINRLRKKLDGMGLAAFITTKFGVGYVIPLEQEEM